MSGTMTTNGNMSNQKLLYNMTYDEWIDKLWSERQNYEHTELTRLSNDNITVKTTEHGL